MIAATFVVSARLQTIQQWVRMQNICNTKCIVSNYEILEMSGYEGWVQCAFSTHPDNRWDFAQFARAFDQKFCRSALSS